MWEKTGKSEVLKNCTLKLKTKLISSCQAHFGWTKKEEKVEEQIREMGWRKRRRKGIWSEKHGRNVLMIEAVTWAQQAGKSLIVSDLKLEFFLFRSGTNISAEMTRYRPVFYQERNRPVDSIDSRPIEPVYGSSGFFGWTPVLLKLIYIRFLMLKNRILIRFSIFPIGPSGHIRVSKPCKKGDLSQKKIIFS